MREGSGRRGRAGIGRPSMGRLGRACLYASFSLGVTAASVLAASGQSLPGEALYPLKQGIEELRVDVLPSRFQADLAAYALGERIDEMGRLSASGQEELAAAMVPAIDREYARLVAFGGTVDAGQLVRIERHLVVLEGLIEKLPATARSAVENIIDRAQGEEEEGMAPPLEAGSGGRGNHGQGDADADSEPAAPEEPDPTASPDRTPKPDPSAKPERTPKPAPTAKPARSSKPEATARPGRIRP